jgi:inosine-uridine nucleoside N-ribohydrolase
VRLHLDTDLGGDPDDACALAMLFGRPDVEITGITTSIDPGGQRAGYVDQLLALAERSGIPVAAGAEGSLSHDRVARPETGERYWPAAVEPKPGPVEAALGRKYDGLPDDLLNFHYDPVTCAVAAGWDGATIEEIAVRPEADADALRLVRNPAGRVRRIVTSVDGDAFAATWLAAVKRAGGAGG